MVVPVPYGASPFSFSPTRRVPLSPSPLVGEGSLPAPSPLVGGGGGGGWPFRAAHQPPHPNPPPQGGREQEPPAARGRRRPCTPGSSKSSPGPQWSSG